MKIEIKGEGSLLTIEKVSREDDFNQTAEMVNQGNSLLMIDEVDRVAVSLKMKTRKAKAVVSLLTIETMLQEGDSNQTAETVNQENFLPMTDEKDREVVSLQMKIGKTAKAVVFLLEKKERIDDFLQMIVGLANVGSQPKNVKKV